MSAGISGDVVIRPAAWKGNGEHPPPGTDDNAWTDRAIAFWGKLTDPTRATFRSPLWTSPAAKHSERVLDIVRFARAKGLALHDLLSMATWDDGFGMPAYREHHLQCAREQWEVFDKQDREAEQAKKQSGRLRILSDDDLDAATERGYIIKGWISPAEISLIVGAKNSHKSFLMLHCARAAAQGRSVFGRRIKQTGVLYVVCEGEYGISKRSRACIRRYGKTSAFHVIAQPIDLLRCEGDANDLRDLINAAKAYNVGWIIVDTVSRVMPGGKENSPEDMGMLLHNLNVLRHETGAHVTGVHHGTKEDGTNSRGHSSLPNGADVIVELKWDDETGIGVATIGFARDDKTGLLGSFTTEEVVLGQDKDGDDETTLIVNELEPSTVSPIAPRRDARKPPELTPAAKLMLEIATVAIEAAGEATAPRPGVPHVRALSRIQLRRRLIDDGWFAEDLLCANGDSSAKLKRGAYSAEHNTLMMLKKREHLLFNRDWVWRP